MTTVIPLTVLETPAPRASGLADADDTTVAGYLSVLGQIHRLRIFRLLMESELCVCELEEELGLSPSLLAHHLRRLKESELIQVRRGIRDARWLYYSINPPVFASLQSFLIGLSSRGGLPARAMCGNSCSCG